MENAMSYTGAGYDPDLLALMRSAFGAAWGEALTQGLAPAQHDEVRSRLAAAICVSADAGERDPLRLKASALRAINCTLRERGVGDVPALT
jgi:hypothetical protein